MKLKVNNEIGRLKKVLLHRPGKELENLTPDILDRLLFDDIPWLELAQKEHDEFSGILRSKGVEVYYIEDMVAKAIEDSKGKEEFIKTFAQEAVEKNEYIKDMNFAKDVLIKYLSNIKDNKELVDLTIAGILAKDVVDDEILKNDYMFIADPLPNLYFQRDPYATIGNGASINTMHTVTRNRETLYAQIMFKYHPEFKDQNIKQWYGRRQETSIEGGDELVINSETLLVGNSQRTRFESIEKLAVNLLGDDSNDFKRVIAFDIGRSRKFMHLDTVFTQVDYDKFSVHPEAINESMNIWYMELKDGKLDIQKEEDVSLESLLKEVLNLDEIKLLPCGNGDLIAGAREQWSDGANTLAISPGEVIVYSRNEVTNKLLEENGIKINVMSSSELSRGRGGPRCMSMPLEREDI